MTKDSTSLRIIMKAIFIRRRTTFDGKTAWNLTNEKI